MVESTPLADQDYRAGVIDFLAALAYGEISAFERLAEDARKAPSLADKLALAGMAVAEFSHVNALLARITELGGDPVTALTPFEQAIDDFHAHTAPADWFESLVKAYVGDALAADFFREVAHQLDPETRALIDLCLTDTGHADFVVQRVRDAIEHEPRIAGRLALWGRRLMGEALSQAQRVAAERDSLIAVLTANRESGFDLAELAKLFTRLTERHSVRMRTLGLDP
jgi:hypothetical protein